MRKSSSISSSNGKIINLLSFDTFRFDTAVSLMHHIWKGPIEVLVFGFVLYQEMGYYGWIGIAFIICFVPIQSTFCVYSFTRLYIYYLIFITFVSQQPNGP